MEDSLSGLLQAQKYLNAEIVRLSKDGHQIVYRESKPIFNLIHDARIIWRQYVPSFNDGDPCIFTLTEPNIVPMSNFEDHDGYNAWAIKYGFDKGIQSSIQVMNSIGITAENHVAVMEALQAFQQMFALEEFFEFAFGQNVEVSIFDNGSVTVDDYDCGY